MLPSASAAPPSAALGARPNCQGSLPRGPAPASLLPPAICCVLVQEARARRPGGLRRRCRLKAADTAVGANSVTSSDDDDGLGVVGRLSDLPKVEALGLELRRSSGFAAPISVQTGKFLQEPFRIRHELTDDKEENSQIIANTMAELLKHFKWNKAVGCSLTKKVMEHLTDEQGGFRESMSAVRDILGQHVKGRVTFFYAAIHSVAAGYTELVWGDSSRKEFWSHRNVLVCTLGQSIGAVLYNDGRRVRNSPLNTLFTSKWQATLPPGASEDLKFSPPAPDSEAFGPWVEQLDGHLAGIVGGTPSVDHIVLVPTGRTARCKEGLKEILMEPQSLPRMRELTGDIGADLIVAQPEDEGSIIRGAAISALIELQADMAMQALEGVINHKGTLDSLSEPQLRSIFNRLDRDCDGVLEPSELRLALSLLGIQRDLDALVAELDTSHDGVVSFEEFMVWWNKEVAQARCVVMTSANAWKRLLNKEPASGFGQLVVLKVTFTFCRSCRAFAPRWRKYSETEEFRTVRFVEIVGNGTCGAMEFCKSLGIKVSPAFFVYRRGGELLCQWTGAKADAFEKNMRKCLKMEAERASEGS